MYVVETNYTFFKLQSYFSRGGAKFIGMIVSPYNRNNPLPYSQITCLVISDEVSADGSYRKFSTKTTSTLSYFCLPFFESLCKAILWKSLCPQLEHHCLDTMQYSHLLSFQDFLLYSSPHCYHGHWAKGLRHRENLFMALETLQLKKKKKKDKISVLLKFFDKGRLAFSVMALK